MLQQLFTDLNFWAGVFTLSYLVGLLFQIRRFNQEWSIINAAAYEPVKRSLVNQQVKRRNVNWRPSFRLTPSNETADRVQRLCA